MSENKLFRPDSRGREKMKISNVNISLIKPQAGIVGFASFVIEEVFYVSGVAIHEKLNGSGYRLTYPTRKTGRVAFNLFHPISRRASEAVENAVYKSLKDVLSQGRKDVGHDSD